MKKKLMVIFLALAMVVFAFPTSVFARRNASADLSSVQAQFDVDIWNSETNMFNMDGINMLAYLLSASTNENGDLVMPQYFMDTINERANLHFTNYDMLESLGISAEDEFVSEYIYVTIGGLKWYPMFLSKSNSDDIVLTFWLKENQQEAWSSYADGYKEASDSSGIFYDGSYYSTYSYDSNYVYGTSSVRTSGLNNPSSHVFVGVDSDTSENIYAEYSATDTHPFAFFTSESSEFTKYMAKPSEMRWQEYQSIDTWNLENTEDNSRGGTSINEYLGFMKSVIDTYKELYGADNMPLQYLEVVETYAQGFIQMCASATNDAYATDIVNPENQAELMEFANLWKSMSIRDVEESSTGDAEADALALQQIEGLFGEIIQEIFPLLATDKYGNHYNFYATGGVNYQGEEYYDEWKEDLLWLPSASEIGAKERGYNGLWGANRYLLMNKDDATVSGESLPYSNKTMLRSAVNGGFLAVGEDASSVDSGTNATPFAVRPAFHLNISKIIEEMSKYETPEAVASISQNIYIGELWNSETRSFNEENLSKLYYYISGSEDAEVADLENILDQSDSGTFNATDIRNVTIENVKYNHQDIVVRIGGYDWYVTYLSKGKDESPVLTLYMTNSYHNKYSYNRFRLANYNVFRYAGNFFVPTTKAGVYGNDYASSIGLNNDRLIDPDGLVEEGMNIEIDENGRFNFKS